MSLLITVNILLHFCKLAIVEWLFPHAAIHRAATSPSATWHPRAVRPVVLPFVFTETGWFMLFGPTCTDSHAHTLRLSLLSPPALLFHQRIAHPLTNVIILSPPPTHSPFALYVLCQQPVEEKCKEPVSFLRGGQK